MTKPAVYMNLKEHLEYRQLTIGCDDTGRPTVLLYNNELLDLENKVHNKNVGNVFLCFKERDGGYIPVLVRDAFFVYSGNHQFDPDKHGVYIDEHVDSFEPYVKQAIVNTLEKALKDTFTLRNMCGSDDSRVKQFMMQSVELIKVLRK